MLTQSDKEFILNHPEMTDEQLAEATKRPIKEITTFVKKNPGRTRNMKKLVYEEGSGIAIMQGGVSQSADELREKSSPPNPYDKPHITKVR